MNNVKSPKTIGIICYSILSYNPLSELTLLELPFHVLPSGKTLLEQNFLNLQKSCDIIYFFVDQDLYVDNRLLRELIDDYEVNLIVKPNLIPYMTLDLVSSWINQDDLMIFGQLGMCLSLEDFNNFELEKAYFNLDCPLVFGEYYYPKEIDTREKLTKNMRSISLSSNSIPAFISLSGELIRWAGLLLISKRGFAKISQLKEDCGEELLFENENFKYNIPLQKSALDLSAILGMPAYTDEPFYLGISEFGSFQNINSHLIDIH